MVYIYFLEESTPVDGFNFIYILEGPDLSS